MKENMQIPMFYSPETGNVFVAAGGEESTAAQDAEDPNTTFIWFLVEIGPLQD